MRRMFGSKRGEMVGWRKLHNEELYNLYTSTNVTGTIKSRRGSLEGHVARMGENRNTCRFLVGNLEGKRPL
jgi:hypothetical protein